MRANLKTVEGKPLKSNEINTKTVNELNKTVGGMFRDSLKRCREGVDTIYFKDADSLAGVCDEYVQYCTDKNLVPTVTGLVVYLGIDSSTYTAYCNLGDERSVVLRKFRDFVQEFVNQNGFKAQFPTFSIFYLKSVCQQYDTPDMLKIQVEHRGITATSEILEELDERLKNSKMLDDAINVDYKEL